MLLSSCSKQKQKKTCSKQLCRRLISPSLCLFPRVEQHTRRQHEPPKSELRRHKSPPTERRELPRQAQIYCRPLHSSTHPPIPAAVNSEQPLPPRSPTRLLLLGFPLGSPACRIASPLPRVPARGVPPFGAGPNRASRELFVLIPAGSCGVARTLGPSGGKGFDSCWGLDRGL